MSLINEALKRAKQAPVIPAPDLPLRPVESQAEPGRASGRMLPFTFTVVGALILCLVWQIARRPSAAPAPEGNPQVKSAAPVELSANPAPSTPVAAPPLAAASEKAPGLEPANPGPDPAHAVTAAPAAETNVVAAPAPPPEPPPLKLQGIVYNPRRPSALISGKSVFVGDRIRDFRVSAITADSVTLSGGGTAKVLSLSE